MCGIAGLVHFKDDQLAKIQDMIKAQKHRGPDGQGFALLSHALPAYFCDTQSQIQGKYNIAFGHCRLAIIDRTTAGIQPMSYADRFWITYNGEIYNYLEIKKELEALNYIFSTNTDTEVILAAFNEWGVQCFEKFNGMWALAIYDQVENKLVLSRDRLGVKPLHYSIINNQLIFSSEIKGILATNFIKTKLNTPIAIDFLKWSIADHTNETFFQDIYSFPAGTYTEIDLSQQIPKKLNIVSYWNLRSLSDESLSDYSEASFKKLFVDSVEIRLRSDVEVGSCLSGGIDSSSIACVASELMSEKNTSKRLNTFHSAFQEKEFDEREWVNLVNDHINAKPHMIFPTAEGFATDIKKLIKAQEEPFASSSIYAQWKVMELANNNELKVLLDGQGADEAFCGYRKYYYFYLISLLRKNKYVTFLKELFLLIKNGDRGFWSLRNGSRYLPSFITKKNLTLENFLTAKGQSEWHQSNLQLSRNNSISERQKDDILKFSVPILLRYEDRNSMAWSIETRVPFLDYRVVEWGVSAPIDKKLSRGRTKAIIRNAMNGTVPSKILNRRDKMGFVTSQEIWMRNELKEIIPTTIQSAKDVLKHLINIELFLKEYELWLLGKSNIKYEDIFRVFILAVWIQEFQVNIE